MKKNSAAEHSKDRLCQALSAVERAIKSKQFPNAKSRRAFENKEARILLLYPELHDYYIEQKREWANKAFEICTTLLNVLAEVLVEFNIRFQNEKDELSSKDLLKILKELSACMTTVMDAAVKVEDRYGELESTLSVHNAPNSVTTLSDK